MSFRIDNPPPEEILAGPGIRSGLVNLEKNANEMPTIHTHQNSYIDGVFAKIKSIKIYNLFKDVDLKFSVNLRFAVKSLNVVDLYKKIDSFTEILLIENRITFAKYKNSFLEIRADSSVSMKSIGLVINSPNVEEFEEIFDDLTNKLEDILDEESVRINLSWYYTGEQGKIKYTNFSEEIDEEFKQEAYPYINIENYVDNFLKSEEPIMVLIGPPGTGKTRFIRYIMKKMVEDTKTLSEKEDMSCLYSSDKEIIESGAIFMDFISASENRLLVMEDVDYHLRPRESGNSSMYNLLSVSNGVIVNFMKKKKVILSTNLPNSQKIDGALLRPGRCFDILHMRPLTKEESIEFLKTFNIKEIYLRQSQYTLAELYKYINTGTFDVEKPKQVSRQVGF